MTARARLMVAVIWAGGGAGVLHAGFLRQYFIEVETMSDEDGTAAALTDLRAVLGQLGMVRDDLTSEQYTDAVLKARQR
jgi:hypothetical protein